MSTSIIYSSSAESSIDSLPIEILEKILSNLDLKSLLVCRSVNRKWKSVIENVKIKELSVRSYNYPKYRYFTFNLQTIHQNFVSNNIDHLFEIKIVKQIFKKIKRLDINFKSIRREEESHLDSFKTIESLNQFPELEVLQIKSIELKKPTLLKLTNLKALSIKYVDGGILELDLPKLEKFETIHDLNKFRFFYPNQITHLYLHCYNPDVLKFKNLMVFYCRRVDEYSLGDRLYTFHEELLSLPLKEVHFYDIIKYLLFNILISKDKLQRNDLKIIFKCFSIENENDFNYLNFHCSRFDDIYFFIEPDNDIFFINYSKGFVMPWLDSIEYNKLVKSFNGRIDQNFHKNFFDIKIIRNEGDITDVEEFSKFIKNCKNLRDLYLSYCSLPTSFYNQLPILAPLLKDLSIRERIELNLEFFFQLKWLEEFVIVQEVFESRIPKTIDKLNLFFSKHYNVRIEQEKDFAEEKLLCMTSDNLIKLSKFLSQFVRIGQCKKEYGKNSIYIIKHSEGKILHC